jgi:phosphatidylserine/phosphatidylglycerophosphate/cardiolipin synthase-like enzyme
VAALAIRKVASPKASHPVTAEWIAELSVDRYRPMLRLLDGEDLEILRSQPDFSPERVREFRRDRCRIFREYLNRLNADFACVCMALKIVMLQSEMDRPELAENLFRHQVRFALGMVQVKARLLLFDLGIGTIQVEPLLSVFDNMRLQLRQMVPESAVWGS